MSRLEINWKKQPRQITFLRACGLSFPFEGGGPKSSIAKVVGYGGSAGGGKAGRVPDRSNPLYNESMETKVLTPKGFKLLGDIKVGDQVCNPDGTVARVIATHDLGIKQFYRITLLDGSSVEASGDHLWAVTYSGKRKRRKAGIPFVPDELRPEDEWNLRLFQRYTVITTKELMNKLEKENSKEGRSNYPLLPLTNPVRFTIPPGNGLRLPPYTLGALIGDGHLSERAVGFTVGDKEIAERIQEELGNKLRVREVEVKRNCTSYRIVGEIGISKDSPQERLRRDRLLGLRSYEKFIPERIKLSSVESRLAFIQGLFDTDGYMDDRGHVEYVTVSEKLAKDVQFILRSLGYKATINTKDTIYTHDGEKKIGKLAYRVYVRGVNNHLLFSLPRKVERAKPYNGGNIPPSNRIVSIEPTVKDYARCITVDHPNSLYITDDFIVTHNSDALLMAGVIACLAYRKCKVGYFRRKYTQLEGAGGAIMRSGELISHIASYNQTRKRWTFPNGSILQFAHLEHEHTVHDYQSQQFDLILFDEATQFTRFQYSYMKTRNRATTDDMPYPFMALATNPGGIGHSWFKDEYVTIGEPEVPHEVEVEEGRFETHVFIPAFLSDNQALEERDPSYRKNLENQPEHIRRQLLEGDWDSAEGLAFTEWNKKYHVIEPFAIPNEWTKFRSLDWGYAKPYSVGWYAIDHDGRLFKYRELYGWGGKPDTGTKETPAEVARKIMEAERGEKITYAVADDAIFGGMQDNSKSIAEQFADEFGQQAVHWSKVGKGKGSRVQGKLEIHHRLRVPKDENGDWTGEYPMLVVFNTCLHTIRTFPIQVLDEKNPEDIDTTLEDHGIDETRYACMSRPIAAPKPKPPLTIIEKHKQRLIKGHENRRKRIL